MVFAFLGRSFLFPLFSVLFLSTHGFPFCFFDSVNVPGICFSAGCSWSAGFPSPAVAFDPHNALKESPCNTKVLGPHYLASRSLCSNYQATSMQRAPIKFDWCSRGDGGRGRGGGQEGPAEEGPRGRPGRGGDGGGEGRQGRRRAGQGRGA